MKNTDKAKTILEQAKKELKQLKESLNFQEEGLPLPTQNISSQQPQIGEGDKMIDQEIEQINSKEPKHKAFIDKIRKLALSAMSELADSSTSEEYKTIKNIWKQCDSYQESLNKSVEQKGNESVTESILKEVHKKLNDLSKNKK